MQARETLKCYKQTLMDNSGGSSGVQNANRNMDSKACAHEASDENEDMAIDVCEQRLY
jgi:hypothetical protein